MSWEDYERIDALRGESAVPRLTYVEGAHLDLSKERTDAAAAYLIKRGIAPERIKREYLGARGTARAPENELWRDRRADVRIIEGGIE